ncbi:MAG TPA: PKD domain-containing protein, partial [Euryarchaeota archaeon]|nr:PKD domain-containing protein [Euryarchaeota archaeon]
MSGMKTKELLAICVAIGLVTVAIGGYLIFKNRQGDDVKDVNRAPIASFSMSSNDVFINEEITFNAGGSMDEDGEIVNYTWNLGDGAIRNGIIVTHGYGTPGTYLVKLTVKDDRGKTSFVTETVTVRSIPTSDGMVVDGSLDDWSDKIVFFDPSNDGTGDVELLEYSLYQTSDSLFFYVKTQGTFPTSSLHRTVLHILLETDNNPNTGYKTHGIGADYVIKTQVENGAVLEVLVERYDGDGYAYDNFASVGKGGAVLSGAVLEGFVPLNVMDISSGFSVKAFFTLQFFKGEDRGNWVISPSKGGLQVLQQSVDTNILSLGANNILDITLISGGKSVSLEQLELKWDGFAPFGHGDCRIMDGQTRVATAYATSNSYIFAFDPPFIIDSRETLDVWIDISGDPSLLRTTTFGLYVSQSGLVSNGVAYVDSPNTNLYYLIEAPSTPKVDGASGDEGFAEIFDPAEGVGMDIIYMGAYRREDGAIFWGVEAKELFRGTSVPTAYTSNIVNYDKT